MSRVSTDVAVSPPLHRTTLPPRPNSWEWMDSVDFSLPENQVILERFNLEIRSFVEAKKREGPCCDYSSASTLSDSQIASYLLATAVLQQGALVNREVADTVWQLLRVAEEFLFNQNLNDTFPRATAAVVLLHTMPFLGSPALCRRALSFLSYDGLKEFIQIAPPAYRRGSTDSEIDSKIARVLLLAYGRACLLNESGQLHRDKNSEREMVCAHLEPLLHDTKQPVTSAVARLLLSTYTTPSEQEVSLCDLELEKVTSSHLPEEYLSILNSLNKPVPAPLLALGLNYAAERGDLSGFIGILVLVRPQTHHSEIHPLLSDAGKSLHLLVGSVVQSLDVRPESESDAQLPSEKALQSMLMYSLCHRHDEELKGLTYYAVGEHVSKLFQKQGPQFSAGLSLLTDDQLRDVSRFLPLVKESCEECLPMIRGVAIPLYNELLSRLTTNHQPSKALRDTLRHAAAMTLRQDQIDTKEDTVIWRSPLRRAIQDSLSRFYNDPALATEVHNEWFGTGNSSANAYHIASSLRVMTRLEARRAGSVRELTSRCGIMIFGRYPIERLEGQCELLSNASNLPPEVKDPPCLVILGTTDWNCSMRHLIKWDAYREDVFFCEASSTSRFVKAFKTYRQLFNVAPQINIHSHASAPALVLGSTREWRVTALERPLLVKLLRRMLEDDGAVVLDGCSLAEVFLAKLETALSGKRVTIYACDGVSSLVALSYTSANAGKRHLSATFERLEGEEWIPATKTTIS